MEAWVKTHSTPSMVSANVSWCKAKHTEVVLQHHAILRAFATNVPGVKQSGWVSFLNSIHVTLEKIHGEGRSNTMPIGKSEVSIHITRKAS